MPKLWVAGLLPTILSTDEVPTSSYHIITHPEEGICSDSYTDDITLQACAKNCESKEGCNFFMFPKSTAGGKGRCIPHRTCSGRSRASTTYNFYQINRGITLTARPQEIPSSVNFSPNNMLGIFNSTEECGRQCLGTTDCKFFYFRSEKQCWSLDFSKTGKFYPAPQYIFQINRDTGSENTEETLAIPGPSPSVPSGPYTTSPQSGSNGSDRDPSGPYTTSPPLVPDGSGSIPSGPYATSPLLGSDGSGSVPSAGNWTLQVTNAQTNRPSDTYKQKLAAAMTTAGVKLASGSNVTADNITLGKEDITTRGNRFNPANSSGSQVWMTAAIAGITVIGIIAAAGLVYYVEKGKSTGDDNLGIENSIEL